MKRADRVVSCLELEDLGHVVCLRCGCHEDVRPEQIMRFGSDIRTARIRRQHMGCSPMPGAVDTTFGAGQAGDKEQTGDRGQAGAEKADP